MTKPKKQNRRKRQNTFPALAVVLGFALISFAFLAMLPSKMNGNTEAANSVVPLKVNFAAPKLSLRNIEGEAESLADYLGSVVLVNNWATWCPPCKAEMPTLVAYHNEHAEEGFSLIAVDAGEAVDVVSQFAVSYEMRLPVWLDPNSESLRAFGNGSLPNSYVIDRTGTVRYAWTGEISMAMLEKYVTPLITE